MPDYGILSPLARAALARHLAVTSAVKRSRGKPRTDPYVASAQLAAKARVDCLRPGIDLESAIVRGDVRAMGF